jgi:conjugative relaxase-like TrwC/TraI family protein
MLSVGRLAAGPDAGRYYEEAVALGREDYYAERGEAPGRWVGSGSLGLGLDGEVADGEVVHLLAAEDPRSGELLGRPLTDKSVAGFDLTFKAPKSVSILFGVAGEDVARELAAAHEVAVEEALGYLEREACRARRGKDGLLQVEGRGFLAARFRHRSSRAGDPLLHDHVVVANRTQGPDGRYTALDARPLLRNAKTAGYLYQAVIRREITDRLGLGFGEVVKGSADLAGFDRTVIDHFSRRRAEIVAEMALHDSHSLYASQAAALATRKGKDYGVPASRLQAEWRARAAEFGLDRDRIDELLRPRLRQLEIELTSVDLQALTTNASTFTRRDVLQLVASSRGAGARVAEIEAEADRLLGDREIVPLSPDPIGELRYTTRELLTIERELIDGATNRKGETAGAAQDTHVDKAIGGRPLSDEQAALVRSLTSGEDGVVVVRAAAGTGKTFALDAAREAWTRSNVDVVGCALSARAAAELREQAAIDTTTIARLTHALDHGHHLPHGGVLVVDEAGMVGSRDLHKLATAAREHDCKLVLVGDDHQLPEIEAGGAFRKLANDLDAKELREVRRQEHEWDRRALTDLREGRVDKWAAAYEQDDRLHSAPNAPAVRGQMVGDWWKAREAGSDSLMIAARTRDVDDLNQRAREQMREHGQLRGADVQMGDRSFSIGDEVVARHNDQRLGVVNGDRGRIVDMEPGRITVEQRDGGRTELPETYARDGHLDHGYAVTAHRAQGATVDRTFVLGTQDSYREWGYTAMTRHRDRADFYITAEQPYLNLRNIERSDPEELRPTVERAFKDHRKQDMAIDAAERLPHIGGDIARLGRAQAQLDEAHERVRDTQQQLDKTRFWQREQRDQLEAKLERDQRWLGQCTEQAGKEHNRLEHDLGRQDPAKPATDPYRDLNDIPYDRAPEIHRGPELPGPELPDLGHDIGPDLGM